MSKEKQMRDHPKGCKGQKAELRVEKGEKDKRSVGEEIVEEGEKDKEDVVDDVDGVDGASGAQYEGRKQISQERLRDIIKHLGDGRGECQFGVIVLKCCCGVGVRHCRVCRGQCCAFVNDIIDILVECGELDPDAEVVVIVLHVVFFMCYYYRVSVERWWTFV